MIAPLGLGIVAAGTCVACLAPRFSRFAAALEAAAGVLVVAGLVMIGSQIRLPA